MLALPKHFSAIFTEDQQSPAHCHCAGHAVGLHVHFAARHIPAAVRQELSAASTAPLRGPQAYQCLQCQASTALPGPRCRCNARRLCQGALWVLPAGARARCGLPQHGQPVSAGLQKGCRPRATPFSVALLSHSQPFPHPPPPQYNMALLMKANRAAMPARVSRRSAVRVAATAEPVTERQQSIVE